MVSSLLLHDREVATFFDLVGHNENDMTSALGWSLSQSRDAETHPSDR